MKITIQRKIGSAVLTLEVEDREDKVAFAKALPLTEQDYCGLCQSNNIKWHTNKVKTDDGKEYIYIKRRCLKCGATSTLGEYVGGGYFWKQWQIYRKPEDEDQDNGMVIDKRPQLEPEDEIRAEQIPF